LSEPGRPQVPKKARKIREKEGQLGVVATPNKLKKVPSKGTSVCGTTTQIEEAKLWRCTQMETALYLILKRIHRRLSGR